MNNNGYQPAGQTTVVVVPLANRMTGMRGPVFLQQGVKVGGMMLGLSCVGCLGMFGIFFVFSAVIMLSTANYDDEFWDDFDRDSDPTVVVGTILLTIGLIMLAACVGLCSYARMRYKRFDGQGEPGRVINPNPGGYAVQPQPAGYPGYPQPAGYPGQPQPAGYAGQPQPGGYPAYSQPAGYPGQPQPAGYPGQPQPAGYPVQPQPAGYAGQPQPYGNPDQAQPLTGYPGQPLMYPEPTTSYPGPPAPYPGQPGGPAVLADPSYPVKPQRTTMNYEYTPPPPHVPGTADMPSAPPPYKP